MNWRAKAACRNQDGDIFYPHYRNSAARTDARAKELCSGCPVRSECLDWALECEHGERKDLRFGIFGGLGPEERFALERAV